MKRTIFLGLAFCALSAFAQTNLSSGIDLKNLDTSIKPGNDFYHYAAGGWLKSHPLDAEHAENGAFVDLQELNQKRIQGIILEYASKPQQKGSLGQKIGSLQPHDGLRAPQQAAPPSSSHLPTTTTSIIKLFTYDRPHRQIQQSFRWREKAFYAQALLRQ